MSFSSSATERGGRWLFALLALLLPLIFATGVTDQVTSSALVVVPACGVMAAIARGRQLFTILAVGVAIIAFVLLLPAGVLPRAEVAGIFAAAVFGISVFSNSRIGVVSLALAFITAFSAAAVIRLLPIGEIAVESLLGLVVAALSIAVLSSEGEVRLPALPYSVLLALILPHDPLRGVLFGLAILLTLILVRFWSLPLLGLVTLSAVAGSLWGIALPAAVIAGRVFRPQQREGTSFLSLPAVSLSRLFLPLLIFVSEVPRRFSAETVALIALLVVALFAPAGVAALLIAAAAGLMLVCARDEPVSTLAVVPVFWALYVLARFGQSGALAATLLPLRNPLTLGALLLTALLVALVARHSNRLASLVAATALVAGVLVPRNEIPIEEVDRALTPGAMTEIEISSDISTLGMVLSGAHLPQTDRFAAVGTILWLDGAGEGHRRTIFLHEIADWGGYRRGHRFATAQALPWTATERVEGFGSSAFIVGDGVVTINDAKLIRRIRVEASRALPQQSRLHVVGLKVTP